MDLLAVQANSNKSSISLQKNATPSQGIERQEYYKGEEEKFLIDFAIQHSLCHLDEID